MFHITVLEHRSELASIVASVFLFLMVSSQLILASIMAVHRPFCFWSERMLFAFTIIKAIFWSTMWWQYATTPHPDGLKLVTALLIAILSIAAIALDATLVARYAFGWEADKMCEGD